MSCISGCGWWANYSTKSEGEGSIDKRRLMEISAEAAAAHSQETKHETHVEITESHTISIGGPGCPNCGDFNPKDDVLNESLGRFLGLDVSVRQIEDLNPKAISPSAE